MTALPNSQPIRNLNRLAAAILLGILLGSASFADDVGYWVMWQDGTQMAGQASASWYDPSQQPGVGGRPLFDAHNPVRVIINRNAIWNSPGPRVEMADGDVLPGAIVRVERMPAAPDGIEILVVAADGTESLPGNPTSTIRVRADAVRRVVFSPHCGRPAEPGELIFRDGRRASTRSLHWLNHGVRALTEQGVTVVAFGELAELHLPEADAILWLLIDATQPGLEPDDLLLTVRTSNGGRFTFPRRMVQTKIEGDSGNLLSLAFQPAWALDAIRLREETVAACTYRRPDEIPVSHLPVSVSTPAAGLHPWLGRRNENVFGGPLTSGAVQADLGFGLHAPCELTVTLPPGSRQFSSLLGLDNVAGDGGCVRCRVDRDRVDGPHLYASGHLMGDEPPVPVGPLDVSGANRLTLTTDMAHDGRPPGADPLDIRDHVNWIMPWIVVALPDDLSPPIPARHWFPELSDWTIAEQDRRRLTLRPWWNKRQGRWQMAMVPDADQKIEEARPFRITRRVAVTLGNGFVYMAAGRDKTDSTYHTVQLLVNGEPVLTTMNGDVLTNAGPGDVHDRYASLSNYVGGEVELSLQLTPQGKAGLNPPGIIWSEVSLRPLILDLPADGQPLTPDVPLSELELLAFKSGDGKRVELQRGKNTDGSALDIRGWDFASGFGVRAGSSLVYRLEPEFRRFVAVLGLCGGWQEVGAYEILLDGESVWTSVEPAKFGRNTPGLQIDLTIPAGHETIELRVAGRESFAAWAAAGFMAE